MNKVIFWSIIGVIIVVTLKLISGILAPFFIAGVISYLLQPFIDHVLLRYKLSRTVVVSVISLVSFGFFVIMAMVLLPIIYQQIALLVNKIPSYNNYLQTELMPIVSNKIHSLDPSIANKIKGSVINFVNGTLGIIKGLANNIWRYTMVTINLFILILLIPIILFYFLRDWQKMAKIIDNLLPLNGKRKIEKLLHAINSTLSAYIRGQLNVCLLLSVYYSISLSLIGLDLAVLLGIVSGLSIIIPFVGIFISFILTMIISYFTFGFSSKLIYIVIIYFIGSTVEGYILTPKIIGDKIGLHPLWIIFAVLAFGNLFGFIGIFFAVPIAGIIRILFLAAIDSYKASKFYKG